MLQDIEHGRAIEIDALLGSVIELARLAKVATPHLDAVYAVDETPGRDGRSRRRRAGRGRMSDGRADDMSADADIEGPHRIGAGRGGRHRRP